MGAKMSCEGRGREDGKWDSQGAAKWGKCSRKKSLYRGESNKRREAVRKGCE